MLWAFSWRSTGHGPRWHITRRPRSRECRLLACPVRQQFSQWAYCWRRRLRSEERLAFGEHTTPGGRAGTIGRPERFPSLGWERNTRRRSGDWVMGEWVIGITRVNRQITQSNSQIATSDRKITNPPIVGCVGMPIGFTAEHAKRRGRPADWLERGHARRSRESRARGRDRLHGAH